MISNTTLSSSMHILGALYRIWDHHEYFSVYTGFCTCCMHTESPYTDSQSIYWLLNLLFHKNRDGPGPTHLNTSRVYFVHTFTAFVAECLCSTPCVRTIGPTRPPPVTVWQIYNRSWTHGGREALVIKKKETRLRKACCGRSADARKHIYILVYTLHKLCRNYQLFSNICRLVC